MKSLIKSFIFAILFSSVAQAAVWETTQEWNQEWENKFSEWVKYDVTWTIFNSGRYRIKTDCADAAYSIRAIFSYEHGLPFAFRNPNKYKDTFTNEMTKFDKLPQNSDIRFMAFLNWVHDMVSSRTTGKDSYSPNITPETITPGAPVLRKGHVYFVKKIKTSGVPRLNYSTVPRKFRRLRPHFGVPSFKDKDMVQPWGGFRAWRKIEHLWHSVSKLKSMGLYSDIQYRLYELAKTRKTSIFSRNTNQPKKFDDAIHERLAVGDLETVNERLARLKKGILSAIDERIEVVRTGYNYYLRVGKRELTEREYDAYSTPSRDRRILDMLDQFTATCKQVTKGIAKGYKCRKQMKDWVFLYDGENEMTVRYFYKKLRRGRVSSDPSDSIKKRWGKRFF